MTFWRRRFLWGMSGTPPPQSAEVLEGDNMVTQVIKHTPNVWVDEDLHYDTYPDKCVTISEKKFE